MQGWRVCGCYPDDPARTLWHVLWWVAHFDTLILHCIETCIRSSYLMVKLLHLIQFPFVVEDSRIKEFYAVFLLPISQPVCWHPAHCISLPFPVAWHSYCNFTTFITRTYNLDVWLVVLDRWTLKMKVVQSLETVGAVCTVTWRNYKEDLNLQQYENLKSYKSRIIIQLELLAWNFCPFTVLSVDFYCTVCMLFMFAGFVISAICELERNAIQLALGSFYPTLLLSGKLL